MYWAAPYEEMFTLLRWECRHDPRGRFYYVDHNTRTTTWQKPTVEHMRNVQQWQQQEASNLQQRSQQHQQRFLLGMAHTKTTQWEDPRRSMVDQLPLPQGWERRFTEQGVNFVLANTRTTTFKGMHACTLHVLF